MIRACSKCGCKNRVPLRRLAEQAKCGSCHTPLGPIDVPLELTSVNDFDELTKSSQVPVVVDFWANWCPPCRMLAPELAKLAKLRAGQLLFAKVNTDELPALAERYSISGIPSLLVFERGRVTRSTAGFMSASALERELELSALN